MPNFNLQKFLPHLKQKASSGKIFVFDPVRKKNILLQPEELVRQLFVHYLIEEKSFSPKLMQIEKEIRINQMVKRFDIVIFDRFAKPRVLVECKQFGVRLQESALRQIAAYNLALHVDYLVVTNGREYHCFRMDYENSEYLKLKDLPGANEIYGDQ